MTAPGFAVCAVRRARKRVSLWQWLITSGATVASTYALDAVATAAGVALVASGLLGGVDHTLALVFLATTYVAWGAGLRVNLRANWALLEETGTSTNVLSKASYDLARQQDDRPHADPARSVDRLRHDRDREGGAVLRRRVRDRRGSPTRSPRPTRSSSSAARTSAPRCTSTAWRARRAASCGAAEPDISFDSDWVPDDYLTDYYSELEPDEAETIPFIVDALRDADPQEPVLFFGVGPTLHHVFAGRRPGARDPSGRLPAREPAEDRGLDRAPARARTTGGRSCATRSSPKGWPPPASR